MIGSPTHPFRFGRQLPFVGVEIGNQLGFDLRLAAMGTIVGIEELRSIGNSTPPTLPATDEESSIQFSEEFIGEGAVLLKACAEHGLEGIISKQALAPYHSGRTKTWLKCKCFTESTFVVVGTDRDRKTGALRALLAHPDSEGLNYAGAAFIALDDDERTEFLAEVERLTTAWAAFKSSRLTDAKWCEPKLMVRVKHLAGSKTLRHATVRGLER